MQQLSQIRKRQGPAHKHHVLSEGSTFWVVARGASMAPAWQDGARLLIEPALLSSIYPGEPVLFHDGSQLIAHRLVRRSLRDGRFQTKADAVCEPDPWHSADALKGRVVALQDGTSIRLIGSGASLWQQRLIGLRDRAHTGLHAVAASVMRSDPFVGAIPSLSASEARHTWAANQVLRQHLDDALRLMQQAGCGAIVLKGQALIASGMVDAADRPMGDVDLLIKTEDRERTLAVLLANGWKPAGNQSRLRAELDDQITFEDPAGVRFDIHWNIVTGGWRFRRVIRPDLDGLWERSRVLPSGWRVFSDEDLFLHLCLHLILSGGGGLKWWRDLESLLAKRGAAMNWDAVAARAKAWRIQGIVWLALDTLWQRWRAPVPLALIQRLRPSPARRVLLRRLALPVAGDARESRLRRHSRELCLMDSVRDGLQVFIGWANPPGAWLRFKTSPVR